MGEGERGRELDLLKREAAAHRERRREAGRNLRWPEGFKRRAAAVMGMGITACELSRALGINRRLLGGWRGQYRAGDGSLGAGFKELCIAAGAGGWHASGSSAGGGIVLTGARGAVVTGLEIHHIAAFLQAGLL